MSFIPDPALRLRVGGDGVSEDRAMVRSVEDGGPGVGEAEGEPGDIGEVGSEPLSDPETVSTHTCL